MGFKEAFTRQGEGENLLFDDDAFYYFAIALLSFIALPLVYVLLKPLLKGQAHKFQRVQKGQTDQINAQRIKAELRFKWLSAGYIFKAMIFLGIVALLFVCVNQLPNQDKIKGFDPYEILEIEPTATDHEIKKAYRRKSLELHPDKNPDDPQANQKFILLTKAYECLTDQDKKDLCAKYGNPDGSNSISVGIAMPSFLLKKENRAAFLALIFLFLLVIVPVIVLNELKSIGKYDDNGVLLTNYGLYDRSLEENLIQRKIPVYLSMTGELSKMQVNSREEEFQLNKLVRDLIEEASNRKITNFELAEAVELNKKAKEKKKRMIISKAFILIYAHLFGQEIGSELQSSYRQVIALIPKIMNSMVIYTLPFSNKQNVNRYRQMGRLQTRFMGMRCINNLLYFSQCIVQGLHESDNPIKQLNYFYKDYLQHIKKAKLPDWNELLVKKNIPSWVPEEFRQGILDELAMFPQIQVTHNTFVDDDTVEEQTIEDLIKLNIKLTRLNSETPIPFVHSNRFTYIREETWHIFISLDDQVFYHKKLNGDQKEQSFDYSFIPCTMFGEQTEFQFLLTVRSDSYRGLDQEIPILFKLKKSSQVKRTVEYHKDDQELDKSLPYLQQILNPFNNQEQEDEDSEEEEQNTKEESQKPKDDSVKQKED